jgi:hypothetical protein
LQPMRIELVAGGPCRLVECLREQHS